MLDVRRGTYHNFMMACFLMARLRVQGETCVVPPGVAQEKSMEGSLAEVAFTIKHYYIMTSRTDSFSANISQARIMVSRLRCEDADEAYESYMDARVAGGSSLGTDKASTVRTVVSVVDMKDEVEVEEESVRKCKSKGVSSDRSPKKAKVPEDWTKEIGVLVGMVK
ncbi:hypothetical protein EDD18DRAFT_1104184 [Armillaria luteobubalina]|uniref:Uncharacterized protein n=1 Tax=Armillaria luteobubalina TaxID=153913 RepID=A0AA39UXY2_9AGAR|nr:hypothetical protein EDD18DRAFT_1104184 [Armillaria luteobubalina]